MTWDAEGRLYTGLGNGTILRVSTGGKAEVFAHTGGRPLGLKFDKNGNLIVSDAFVGLLSVDKQGKVCILAAVGTHKGVTHKIHFADYHTIADDGKIYFTDASEKGYHGLVEDLLEGRPFGSLLQYDPATGETTYLAKNELYFPNGVEITPSGDALLVAESYKFRLRKYWLTGSKKGTWETVADGFPGIPDNISISPRGTVWVALSVVRTASLDVILSYTALKRLIYRLPQQFVEGGVTAKEAALAEVSKEGKIIRILRDLKGEKVWSVTSAEERGGYLYLGSYQSDVLAKYKL